MKRIVLISANTHRSPYPVYPLGVSYLQTYLESAGCRVELLDCNLDSDETIAAALRKEEPLFVGISLRNADGANSLQQDDFVSGYSRLTDLVRRNCNAPIVIGGAGFSIFPREFMHAIDADYGVTGEGEESLRLIAEALSTGKPLTGIENLVWREVRKSKSENGNTEDTTDIRINPRSCYLATPQVRFDDRLVDYYWHHSGMLNIQTKRGCPYNCVYCSYPVIDGRKVRTLDPDEVVESISRLKRDKGIDYFFFTDSVFNIADDYNALLAEKLIRADLGIRWGAYFSPRNITREAMSLFARSGLTHVEFGTESISDECLERYGKQFTVEDVIHASEVCLDAGVFYAHFLILGGYGETRETLRKTMENSKRIRHSVFFPFVGMRIYPHTALAGIARREDVIAPDDGLFAQKYYIAADFDLDLARTLAAETGKAWVFPDDPESELVDIMRLKRGKKGPLWEYLRKP